MYWHNIYTKSNHFNINLNYYNLNVNEKVIKICDEWLIYTFIVCGSPKPTLNIPSKYHKPIHFIEVERYLEKCTETPE